MRSFRVLFAAILTCAPASLHAQQPKAVVAVVESSLKTGGGQIRQFAFDGNADSYFASVANPGKDDHFTLIFDQPVAVRAIDVSTGKPKGGEKLDAGALEMSADGKTFAKLADFADGLAHVKPDNVKIKALRIRTTAAMKHPLVIREFSISSEPKVAVFKYPVEFNVDVSDAPEMKPWADKVARLCERNYTMINDELPSEGFKPRTQVSMTLKKDYKGVAAAGGGRITGSVKYFKSRPEDVGAMIHETVHVVQSYRVRGPGWLVEGIADYIRFFKFEPGKIGKLAKDPHFNGSYRTSAAFLNFAATQYDKDLVKKLNKAMREGEYREEIWKSLTKKTLKELDDEWRASLKKPAAAQNKDAVETALIPLVHLDAAKTAAAINGMFPGIKSANLQIEAEVKSNSIRVRGSAENVKAVRLVIGAIDVPKEAAEKKVGVPGPAFFKAYDVPTGNDPAELIKVFLKKMGDKKTLRIVANPPNRIFVYADPATHAEIATHLAQVARVRIVTETVPIRRPDVGKFAASLREMFPAGPMIVADPKKRLLTLRGTANEINAVKSVIAQLDAPAKKELIISETVPVTRNISVIAPIVCMWGNSDVEVIVDYQKNAFTLRGPESRVREIAKVVRLLAGNPNSKPDVQPKKLDPPAKGKVLLEGAPYLRMHPVPAGTSAANAKWAQDVFPQAHIITAGSDQIAVWADPQTHFDLQLLLEPCCGPRFEMAFISLARVDAAKTATALMAKFSAPDLYIEADTESNAIRVRGALDQVNAVRSAIAALDGEPQKAQDKNSDKYGSRP